MKVILLREEARGEGGRERKKDRKEAFLEHLIFQLARILSMEWREIISKKGNLDSFLNRIFLSFLSSCGNNNKRVDF